MTKPTTKPNTKKAKQIQKPKKQNNISKPQMLMAMQNLQPTINTVDQPKNGKFLCNFKKAPKKIPSGQLLSLVKQQKWDLR